MHRLSYVTTITATLFLGGCDQSSSVDSSNGGTSVAGENSQPNSPSASSPPALPAGFRADIPIYPDSRITSTFRKMVGFETTAGVNAVRAFYKTELPKNGWEVEEKSLGGHTAFTITKNNRRFLIAIGSSPIRRGTIIAINSSTNEPPKLIGGATRDRIPFMFAKWRPSLAVMIVGLSGNHGAGGSPGQSRANGSVPGHRWEVTTEDGRTGDFKFDDRAYDLAKGKVFTIRLEGDQAVVHQLNIDLSRINAQVEDCQKFIHDHPQIAVSLSSTAKSQDQVSEQERLSLDGGKRMPERTWKSADGSRTLRGSLVGADDISRKMRLEISGRPPKDYSWDRFHEDDIAYLEDYCRELRKRDARNAGF